MRLGGLGASAVNLLIPQSLLPYSPLHRRPLGEPHVAKAEAQAPRHVGHDEERIEARRTVVVRQQLLSEVASSW